MCEKNILAGLENPLPHGLDEPIELKNKIKKGGPVFISPDPANQKSPTTQSTDFQPDIEKTNIIPQVGGVGDPTSPGEGVVLYVL